MDHKVRIGTMATTCQFKAAPARREFLRQAVDRSCRTGLDTALQHALSPVLAGQNGVIRIRRLDLNLTSTNPLSNDLTHMIAGRIAALVRTHLQHGRDGVQTWPDHDHFMAHYVLWRLGLLAGADWAFTDFDALQHLSPQQAVIEVLIARPSALIVLARDSILHDAPDAFSSAFEPQIAATLLSRLSDINATQDLVKLREYWETQSDKFQATLPKSVSQPLAQGAVSLLLRMSAILREPTEPQVSQLAFIARIFVALSSLPALALLSTRTTWPVRLAALQGKPVPAPALALLAQIAAQPDGSTLLDCVAKTVADQIHNANIQAAPNATKNSENANQTPAISAPAAGLALLIPSLIRLTAKTPLTDKHRHAIAIAALPHALKGTTARNAGFLRLFPHNPQEPEPTDWPTPDLSGLPEHLLTASDGSDLWAQAAMAYFADRLPGLRGSSAGYLQDQFLTCTGDIEITETELNISLHRVPLGIVLSMGGHLGNRNRIPWHDNRTLSISIKGGV